MNHNNPDSARTKNDCARLFCGEIRIVLAYASKSIQRGHCLQLIEEYRSKFRTAVPTIVTEDDVIIRVGEVLMKFMEPIRGYDDKFFSGISIIELFERGAQGRAQALAREHPISDSDRDEFYSSTTPLVRTNIMDALNILLVFYAKYNSFRE